MSDFTGNRNWLMAAVAMAAMLSAHAAPTSLAGLVDSVVAHGAESQLPAHLSVVLGISPSERETAVKQAVIRDGQMVHTFNVCTAKTDDIVIMSVDEKERATKAYRVTVAGVLRKAVSYHAGAPAIERSLTEARADFGKEMKFWIDIERGPAGSK